MSDTETAIDRTSKPPTYGAIDHIAFAVRDLEHAILVFRDVLGFSLMARRTIRGANTGMVSAEMEHNGIRFVLCQGTEETSQVSRLISAYGPGVAHIALTVDDVQETANALSRRGMSFDTDVIDGPGLTQTFTSRCDNTGICFELINRDPDKTGFDPGNVEKMFNQLEQSGRF